MSQVHQGVDVVWAYCTPRESLEHLCFRLEEWIFEYGINCSFKPTEDHPDNTTFAIFVRAVFVPPPEEHSVENPSYAAVMGHHWQEHKPDRVRLAKLVSHPDEQLLCLTGTWFAATYALQGCSLVCGPKLRRLPPHDGDHDDEPPPTDDDGAAQKEALGEDPGAVTPVPNSAPTPRAVTEEAGLSPTRRRSQVAPMTPISPISPLRVSFREE